ncbi:uracil-xanthine permease family protein [Pseudoflavonifractor sp. MSJ-37]|uniref:uracil-xanthine permease family protein n=1 Tax=Pseudoflavonifractor sp. MSJ-37 TaxID=2841531 RepID=UPI001C1163B2|nr:solute carrier family 23 protein [Pseudoflavonifractor sp. MSJ-37]MBU5434135.1 purine/pyrimidine permease [Pseudoflavonifractor sp. MSJ-37]
MENIKYGINDRPTLVKTIPLAFQHVLSAFAGTLSGGLMLATGMGMNSQETALVVQCAMLICAFATIVQSLGIGPIGARLPIVTGGSYTLIAPMVALSKNMSIGEVFGSSFVAAIALTLLGPLAVKYLHRFFSPVVTGGAVLAVGMCLMGSAFSYMVNLSADPANEPQIWLYVGIALFTLMLTLILDSFTKGFIQSCSILIAIIVGYILCVFLGLVDFTEVGTASWLALPRPVNFGFGFKFSAIITLCVVHIATVMENIGDTTGVVSGVEDRLPTKQELMRAVRGDGFGSIFAALFNGLPVISGSPNVGIICMTGVGSRFVTLAGGIIIGILAFFPKFAQILALTPYPVLGGVLFVSFGTIAASGIRVIGMSRMSKRDITVLAMAIVVGIGGNWASGSLSFLPSNVITLITGIPGTALTALILNMILPRTQADKEYEAKQAEENARLEAEAEAKVAAEKAKR